MKLRCPACKKPVDVSFTGEEEGIVGFACPECNKYSEGEIVDGIDFKAAFSVKNVAEIDRGAGAPKGSGNKKESAK